MEDNKWKEQKEEHFESKTMGCYRRKTSEVKKIFQVSFRKPSWSHWQTYSEIINSQLDIKQGQFTEEELDTILKDIKKTKPANLDEISPGGMEDKKIF